MRHQQRFLVVQAACARLPVIILRLLQRKIMHRAAVPFHGAAKRIVRIQHLHRFAVENHVFGARVIQQVVIAVQMVFGNVQAGGGIGIQQRRGFQLEAGQFQHPHVGRLAFARQPRFQHGRADIARHHGIQTALRAQMPHQAGGGGFAVAAGDGDDFVRLPAQQIRQNRHIAHHFAAALFKFDNLGLAARDARTQYQHVITLQRRVQAACKQRKLRKFFRQFRTLRFRQLRIVTGRLCTNVRAIGQHGNARAAQSGYQNFLIL